MPGGLNKVKTFIYFYKTSIGRIGIAERGSGITNLYFPKDEIPDEVKVHETPILREAAEQLKGYLNGEIEKFSLPLVPEGTAFMKQVWKVVSEIPYGSTATYREIAAKLGSPKAARAVGYANSRNPIPIFIPCHRVIGSNSSLTGYRGGLELKRKLLSLEKR